jgi:hypothetical protein
MPGTKTIFRRLNKPAKDYLSKADRAVVEMDSTESQSSHTEIMSIDSKKDEKQQVVSTESATTAMTMATKEDASSSFSSSDNNNNNVMCSTPVTPEPSDDGFGTSGGDISINQKLNNDDEKRVDDKTEKEVTAEEYNKVVVADEKKEEEQERSNSQQQQQQQRDSTKRTSKEHKGRIVSLDHNNNGDGKQQQQRGNSSRRNSRHQRKHDDDSDDNENDNDDESSSDDDSSYFATNLPSPKSGRTFSISSNASNASAPCARTNSYQLQKQDSDASLSFSDESDDDHHHHNSNRNNNNNLSSSLIRINHNDGGIDLSGAVHVQPKRSVADMNLYPQRITRMHSVSSLVSSDNTSDEDSDDDDDDDDDDEKSPPSVGNRRRSFTGDSMTSSLPSVASVASEPDSMTMNNISNIDAPPTGDVGYYVPGHQEYMHTSSLSSPSPSGMIPYYYSPQQQQQQPMTNQQMTTWATTAPSDAIMGNIDGLNGGGIGASDFDYYYQQQLQQQQQQQLVPGQQDGYAPQRNYGRGNNNMTSLNGSNSEQTFSSKNSSGSIPLVYSEDEDGVAFRSSDAALALSLGKQHAGAASGISSVPRSAGNNRGGNGLGSRGENNESGPSGGGFDHEGSQRADVDATAAAAAANGTIDLAPTEAVANSSGRTTFKVYWQRWLMLFYMSLLNLLSDWTCYSVAPISLLAEEAFGNIDPERLVVVFLGANALGTACEPIILARLGLRRTVLLGSLLLMIGSIVKSGGLPPIIPASLEKGHSEWSIYLGFFIVGLSQPLYQCTPALLSASWFPEEERTMATGVALNANQLGIGFAFIFGTLLVSKSDDIPAYFGLLSQISTLVFIGTLIQFDDAPPTPPSSSAKVVKGNLNFKMQSRIANTGNKIKNMFTSTPNNAEKDKKTEAPSPASKMPVEEKRASSKPKKSGRSSSSGGKRGGGSTRRRTPVPKFQTANTESGLSAPPSSAHYGSTKEAMRHIEKMKADVESIVPHAHAPSPAMGPGSENDLGSPNREDADIDNTAPGLNAGEMPMPAGPQGGFPPGMVPPGPYGYGYPPPPPNPYQIPYWDPRVQEQMQQQQAYYQQHMYYQQQMQQQQQQMQQPPMGQGVPPQMPYFPPPQQMAMPLPYSYQNFPPPLQEFDPRYGPYDLDVYEDGAEPTVTVTDHHLDINIRDDQVIRSLHACMIRPGFSHALAAFTVSGIVINTLSTYMDYLVRLNGAPRTYTGIVGGAFQFIIMISSLVMGKQTDKTRAYYSVTIGMLVLGAFGLAECGVSLDSDRGGDLRWSLLLVAVLVGPLQPISTELGVEVAYPLSENTVLVIQQLFSNLLSAIFIPFFKSLKSVGTTSISDDGDIIERPDFTFSFYLLIVIHTLVTVYFATFNGKYLRYEHELQKKAEEDQLEAERNDDVEADEIGHGGFVHPFHANNQFSYYTPQQQQQPYDQERQPLMQNI